MMTTNPVARNDSALELAFADAHPRWREPHDLFVPCVLSLQDDKNGYDVQPPELSHAWAHNTNWGVSIVLAPIDDWIDEEGNGHGNGYAVAKLTAANARELAARIVAGRGPLRRPRARTRGRLRRALAAGPDLLGAEQSGPDWWSRSRYLTLGSVDARV
jgi:hypothetical protein